METTVGNADYTETLWGISDDHLRYILQITRVVLGVSGVFVNLVVIVLTAKPSLKTNVKLCLSLAFADMLIAAFHVSFAFISIRTPWQDDLFFEASVSEHLRNTSNTSGIVTIDMDILPAPIDAFSLLDPPSENEQSNEMFGTSDTSILTHFEEITQELFRQIFNSTNSQNLSMFETPQLTFDNVENNIEETWLQKFLSAFYFMPNIAGVLSMLGITTCLLVTVTNPLKHHLILSKARGTTLVLTIWSLAFLVSLGIFIYRMVNDLAEQSEKTADNVTEFAHLIVWLTTIVIFFIIACMYGVILYGIYCRRQNVQHTGSQNNRTNIRATVTALAITGSYAVCYLPFVWMAIIQRVVGLANPFTLSVWWFGIMQILYVLNSNTDAIIYSLRLPEVSKKLKNLCWKVPVKCFQH